MSLPAPDNKIWADLITGVKVMNFDFLAVKIYLGTAQRMYKTNPETLRKSAIELHEMFVKHSNLPSVQKDIEKFR